MRRPNLWFVLTVGEDTKTYSFVYMLSQDQWMSCCILICKCMQKHIQHNKDNSSLEKYTSHFIERVVCERELETEQRLQHTDPQLFWLSQPFFPVLPGCSTGGLGAQPLLGHGSHSSIFSPTDLNFLSPGLYNNLTPTYFLRVSQFTLNSTRQQSRPSPDIFDRMHLLFTQVHFSSDSLAGLEVNMQHFFPLLILAFSPAIFFFS